MIKILTGDLYWEELDERITEFSRDEKFHIYKMNFQSPHQNHKFLTSCDLFTSFINWSKFGKTDKWSARDYNWFSGPIEKEYAVGELIDELQDNLLWVRNYLIDNIIYHYSFRNIKESEISLLSDVKKDQEDLFHYLRGITNVEEIWIIFKKKELNLLKS